MKRELWKCDRCKDEWDHTQDNLNTFEKRGHKAPRQLIRVEVLATFEPEWRSSGQSSALMAHVCRDCAEKLGLTPAMEAANKSAADAAQAKSHAERIADLARDLFGLLVEERPSA